MPPFGRLRPRRVLVLLVAGLAAAGCTASPTDPSAADAADAFIGAWSKGDTAAMAGLLAPEERDDWDAAALADLLAEHEDRGQIEDLRVERTAAVDQPDDLPGPDAETEPARVPVTYEIVFRSAAAAGEVALQGTFDLEFDAGAGEWVVDWDEALLWPGIDGAAGFRVGYRWPRRAAILDRKGRPLARGAAETRTYPQAAVAGTTVGHIEPLSKAAAAEAPEGRRRGDLVGGSGLEAGLEERLAGVPRRRLEVVDAAGEVVEVVGRRPGRRTAAVRTTLDLDVQRAAEAAYGATVGGAVVMDPRSGHLLAVVSSSPFNPAGYVGVAGIEPFNRAVSGAYPPGSAMKVVTATAALETGVVTPSTQLAGPAEFRGVRNFESGSFSSLDFASAVQNSVNTAFAQVALDLGGKRLTRYAEAFGFNEPPALPLDAATSSFPSPEDEGDLMWGSIGQAQVLATPLQMATVAATVANDGVRIEPRIVRSEPREARRVVSRRTARTMTDLMEGVVVGGTGQAARISGLRVAGKTGTAEVDVAGERKNHAWFICFAPAENPRVAVAVVAEYGGIGGQVAAPLARDILVRVLPLIR
ncbi:MAG: peptidoglycan D,D-transpeptidase FtsI family protein [Actinomycetota bacterium]